MVRFNHPDDTFPYIRHVCSRQYVWYWTLILGTFRDTLKYVMQPRIQIFFLKKEGIGIGVEEKKREVAVKIKKTPHLLFTHVIHVNMHKLNNQTNLYIKLHVTVSIFSPFLLYLPYSVTLFFSICIFSILMESNPKQIYKFQNCFDSLFCFCLVLLHYLFFLLFLFKWGRG